MSPERPLSATLAAAAAATEAPARAVVRAHPIPRRVRDALCVATLAVTDVAATFAAVGLAWLAKAALASRWELKEMTVFDLADSGQLLAVTVVAGFLAGGLYLRREPFWEYLRLSLCTLACSLTLALTLLYLSQISVAIPRSLAVLSGIAILLIVPPSRLAALAVLSSARLWRRRVAVIGLAPHAQAVADDLESDYTLGYRVVGILPPESGRLPTHLDETVVVASGLPPAAVDDIVARAHRGAATVTLVPEVGPLPFASGMTRFMFDRRRLLLTTRNLLKDPANLLVKRVFDLLASSIIAVAALPLLAVLALAVVLDSRGAPIFSQTRIGRNGKRFRCLKFRTMHTDAEERLERILAADPPKRDEWEQYQKLKEDPRVTRVGRFLRRTSLDELPQIFNVLMGSMSLVGPRPLPQYHYEKLQGPFRSDYVEVTPGITGLWQVSGRSDADVNRMAVLNSWYARNWSLWLDLTLLIRTAPAVLCSRGAY
ncbi:MAG: exopolysaccharide biosynthesis polyprenyl glycosylphosphotransferase [Planctomycetia bacterium]|nr:exopolysaccharide biosynthesis polyprenyl glycosylphosphotransferase [Planctomycetia bacterium]